MVVISLSQDIDAVYFASRLENFYLTLLNGTENNLRTFLILTSFLHKKHDNDRVYLIEHLGIFVLREIMN